MFEASRRTLQDAFASEGASRPSAIARYSSGQFGLFFGHGMSGTRAFVTLLVFWLFGGYLVTDLQRRDFLIVDSEVSSKAAVSCRHQLDPLVFAADAMIPLLDLGEEKKCRVGAGPTARSAPGIEVWGKYRHLAECL